MAVNTALMALMKKGIFCTEPYRVPFAGKVDAVLFDKTGTLTSDRLLPECVVNATAGTDQKQQPVADASAEAATVLAGCHSLVAIAGGPLAGDPIELAALEGLGWEYEPKGQVATPGTTARHKGTIAALEARVAGAPPPGAPAGAPPPPPLTETQKAAAAAELKAAKEALAAAEAKKSACAVRSVRILGRHHFASALQRMSTVADVEGANGGGVARHCLVKGSPEALKPLLAQVPEWYEASYRGLAEKGMRVLALASKVVDAADAADAPSRPREWVESGLTFRGFIAFACKTRSDSRTVVTALRESAHAVVMITGDAPLTAHHVAREVNICTQTAQPALLLTTEGAAAGAGACWALAVTSTGGGGDAAALPKFDAAGVMALGQKRDLLVTEAALEAAAEATGGADSAIWSQLGGFLVFARMSPQGKAKVIRNLQQRSGAKVFMCGDGGNDVGALKQADVGLALLSGYGNTNTNADAPETVKGAGGDPTAGDAEKALNAQAMLLQRKAAESARLQKEALAKKQKELQAQQQIWLREMIEEKQARGEEVGVMDHMRALKESTKRFHAELMAERRRLQATGRHCHCHHRRHRHLHLHSPPPPRLQAIHGNVFDGCGGRRRRRRRGVGVADGPPRRRVGGGAVHVALAVGPQHRRPHPSGAVHAALGAAAAADHDARVDHLRVRLLGALPRRRALVGAPNDGDVLAADDGLHRVLVRHSDREDAPAAPSPPALPPGRPSLDVRPGGDPPLRHAGADAPALALAPPPPAPFSPLRG